MYSKNENIWIKPFPYLTIFLLLFLALNFLGIFNFSFYTKNIVKAPLLNLVFIGLAGFVSGTLLIRILKINFRPLKGTYKPHILKAIFLVAFFASLVLVFWANLKSGGIILLMGTQRFSGSTFITLFVYIGIVATCLYFAHLLLNNEKIKKRQVAFFILQALAALSMGYRGPLVVLVGSCFMIFFIVRNDHYNKYKNVFSIRYGLIFLAGIILMSTISTFRVAQQYNVRKFFRNINMDYVNKHPYLKPYISTLSVFRYDQEVVTTLIEKTENKHLYGELAIANLLTVLPGMQLGARNKIGEIIEARKFPDGRPWSITPTLQGALFVDGGRIFVFLGFFLLAALIEYLKKMMLFKGDPFSIVLYVIIAVNSLMLIHSGYFDVLVYILILLVFIIKFLVMRIIYKV